MRMMSWTALSLAAGMSSCSLLAAPIASVTATPAIKAAPAPTQMVSASAAASRAVLRVAAG